MPKSEPVLNGKARKIPAAYAFDFLAYFPANSASIRQRS